jgi:hypothetical protein
LGSIKYSKKSKFGKVESPLNKKLETVEWGEYKLGDLFEKINLRFKKSKFDKQNDISKNKSKEFNLPLVNAKDGENGIMYYGRSKDFESSEMTIDIVNDGAVSTGNVYPQPQKTGVLYNAYLIKPKFEITERLLYFFSSTIQKSIKLKFGYENKAGWEKVKKEKIQLPTKNNKIDFDFMEKFINELETERIKELDAYLTATDLKDYHLTDEEQKVLDEFENIEWGEYNLEKLFGKSTRGKRLKSDDRIDGNLPFVTAGETDEGISAYIGNSVEVFLENTTTIDMFGSAKYRNYKYGGDDHIAVVHTEKLSQFASIFVTSAIHKSSYTGEFHYGRNFYAKDADNLNISLPTKNNQPNYQLMETLISAIQKQVIKDVVLYSDRKIVKEVKR